MVQVNIRISESSAQKLKELASESGLALGALIEKMMDCYHHASTTLSPASGDAITRLSDVVADLEARMLAMETRLSAMAVGAAETALQPVLLAGKGRVAGTGESSPAPSEIRENKAQKRSLHSTPNDQFDELVRQHLAGTMTLTGHAMRDAGYSFPQKRLVESWARLNAK